MNSENNVNKTQMPVREKNVLSRLNATAVKRWLKDVFEICLPALLVAVVFTTVLESGFVSGRSMNPTFHDGQFFLAQRVGYTLRHGDVITFKAPTPSAHAYWIKRVIGLPGDVLQFDEENQVLYRNGKAVSEPYLAESDCRSALLVGTAPFQVPDDCLFVMGDNRQNSMDSRSVGFVPVDSVTGKVLGYGCSDDNDR